MDGLWGGESHSSVFVTLRTCSKYWKGPLNLVLCVSKKIVTAQHTNRIICQEKWKKLRFWKNEAQNRVGIFWQNPIFWAETFFQRPLENFLLAWRTCSRYLKGPLKLVTQTWSYDTIMKKKYYPVATNPDFYDVPFRKFVQNQKFWSFSHEDSELSAQ